MGWMRDHEDQVMFIANGILISVKYRLLHFSSCPGSKLVCCSNIPLIVLIVIIYVYFAAWQWNVHM